MPPPQTTDSTVTSFEDLLDAARAAGPATVVVAAAGSETALRAVGAAVERGIARAVLVGDPRRIGALVDAGIPGLEEATVVAADPQSAAAEAVARIRDGDGDVLLKGALRTDELLRAVLDREAGLRTGRLLSDVLLYEDRLNGRRLVAVTDGGINPAPDEAALRQIVRNAVAVLRALGVARPRVALLSATEAVTESVPSTARARAVAEWAAEAVEDADVQGPLALDNALLPAAAAAKGVEGPVAGRADVMVVPSIEAGNILGKGVKYLGGSLTAHVVVGAGAPVLIPSRVESAEDKLHSIALGVLVRRAGA